ncbi:MAG: hypothetical protein ACE5I7_04385 [Candidatus Binatia bacterium]
MPVQIADIVMLAENAPYPRYGRVVRREGAAHVRVTDVQCGDPRCVAEHRHAEQVWRVADLLAARAYQPRAAWEAGRKSSPNAPAMAA